MRDVSAEKSAQRVSPSSVGSVTRSTGQARTKPVARRFGIPVILSPSVLRTVRASLFLLALMPLMRLLLYGFTNRLGANPVEFLMRSLGTWTLVLLLVTLTITPLRHASGWTWLVRLRRMFGLFAFFYACLHLTAYVWLDQWFDLKAMWGDVLKRPFITAGAAAFVMLIPLALTSTNAWVRRLGAVNWQRLHRLVYAIGIAGVLHYWWHKAGKNDLEQPALYASALALLLSARLLRAWRTRGSLR